MTVIDLRSDTVTKPTLEMREAMKVAEVGDDVFGDDPTVNELEEQSASRLGKEKGLFVASGTMGNLVAVLTHCGRGDEILLARGAHIFQHEQGSAATLGGITMNPIGESQNRPLQADDIEKNISPVDVHKPITRLVTLENTLNGIAIPKDEIDSVCEVASKNKLATHLDGARIFNAATALKVSVCELVEKVDTVQFCFSKGLSAPVGSMLVGPASFINKARHWRKTVGGGMRQAGVLAGPCLIALNEMTKRLEEDHKNAYRLASAVNELEGIKVNLESCHTNMVSLKGGRTAHDLVQSLHEKGLFVLATTDFMIRAVTHHGITASDIDRAIEMVGDAVKELNDSKAVSATKR